MTFRSPLSSSLLTAKLAALNVDTTRKIVAAVTRLKLDPHGQPFPYWDDEEVRTIALIFGAALQRAAAMTREDTVAQMVARSKLRKAAPKATTAVDPRHLEEATTRPMRGGK